MLYYSDTVALINAKRWKVFLWTVTTRTYFSWLFERWTLPVWYEQIFTMRRREATLLPKSLKYYNISSGWQCALIIFGSKHMECKFIKHDWSIADFIDRSPATQWLQWVHESSETGLWHLLSACLRRFHRWPEKKKKKGNHFFLFL